MHNDRSGCRVKPTDTLYKPWNLATEPFCSPCTTDSNLPELLVNHIAGDFADTDSEAESKLSISSIVSDDIDDISTLPILKVLLVLPLLRQIPFWMI